METLHGTPRQVEWAEKIRAELLAMVDATSDAPITLALQPDERAIVRQALMNSDRADWLIDWWKSAPNKWDVAHDYAMAICYGVG